MSVKDAHAQRSRGVAFDRSLLREIIQTPRQRSCEYYWRRGYHIALSGERVMIEDTESRACTVDDEFVREFRRGYEAGLDYLKSGKQRSYDEDHSR